MGAARDRILKTAQRRCARHGPKALSMRGVASELGVTATSIYRHYQDKDALLDAIVEAGFALLARYLRRRRRSTGSRVLGVIESFLDFALEEPRLYEVMFLRRRAWLRTFPQDFAQHRSVTFDILRAEVDEEMRRGLMRRNDSLLVSLGIWAHAHGLISMFNLGRFGAEAAAFRRLYRRSTRLLYRGLTLPPQ